MQATAAHNVNFEKRHFPERVEQQTSLIPILNIADEAVFERVFKEHFKALHAYACTILKDEMMAEEVVQSVFLKIWEKKERISFDVSLKAYLYRAVYNDSLNVLKHEKIKSAYQTYSAHRMKNESDHSHSKLMLGELEQRIREALNELPEQCRTIFQMSRFEELKYKEIAARLGISEKTVENQMGKALKLMRLKLSDFLPALLLALLNF
ncbi:MAG: RNA polymerase sigma-70 factor [Chitinophagaceae bacterium]